jgi:hypothetical protein
MLYGRLPTRRIVAPSANAVKSTTSTSASTMRSTPCFGASACRRGIRSRSISIAVSVPTRSSSGQVNAPCPGPISMMRSPACGSIGAQDAFDDAALVQEVLAEALAGDVRCSFMDACSWSAPSQIDRIVGGEQAARIGHAATGQIERGAVIDRGADVGQAERDVHGVAEGRVLEHRQSLVVIHREHGVGIARVRAAGTAVSAGSGPSQPHALRAQRIEHRRDDIDLLAPEMPAFAGVRVEPQPPGCAAAAMPNCRRSAACRMRSVRVQRRVRDGGRHRGDSGRCVVASATRSSPADQHHHHLATDAIGEELGVPAEGESRRR